MKYSEYLKELLGMSGELNESEGSWFTFIIGRKGGDYQLAEVNEDYVIVQCKELPRMMDAIPLSLFQVRIYKEATI